MSLAWLLFTLFTSGPAEELRIQPTTDAKHIEVSAVLPASLRAKLPKGEVDAANAKEVLWLSVVLESGKKGPPIFGRYERKGNRLIFRPRFALTATQLYHASFAKSPKQTLTRFYRVPDATNGKPPVVVKVYPTSSVLPANHLRFVIIFSQPMRGGRKIFDQIKIVDENGEEITGAWLYNELWNEDGTMLVLYIHPGRIKWGVLLRMTLGPVLRPNRRYSLVISPDMLGANGRPLGKRYTKEFRATAENRKRIALDKCRVTPPQAGSDKPLTLKFPNIIDRNSLLQYVRIENAAGKTIAGKITIGAEERAWLFQPSRPWQAEEYNIVIDPRLEDHAGNSPLRPFDLDLKAPKLPPQKLRISFSPQ